MNSTPEAADYQCLQGLGSQRAHIRFDGTLQGRAVHWDAVVQTLHEYRQQHPGVEGLRNFIDIGGESADGRQLHVCINVACIDHPTLLKTIHMIRHYKRLAPGRHAYGPVLEP